MVYADDELQLMLMLMLHACMHALKQYVACC